MGTKLDRPARKILIKLFAEDIETLRQFYPDIGSNMAVREMVRRHCKRLRERASREGATANVAIELEPDDDLVSFAGASNG